LRHGLHGEALWGFPTPPFGRGIRRHGHRPGQCAAHHRPARGPDLGRRQGQRGRHFLFLITKKTIVHLISMITLRRILLVEDKAKDVELTLGALEEHRLANGVAVVRDGVEALDYLYARGKFAGRSDGDPAVVLLDIKMPRMDGLEVLRRVKADPQMKEIPIVMLTSSREEPDLKEAYELGVNAYVVKPVGFEQFTEAVRQVGAFWAVLNELPPDLGREETGWET